MLPFLLNLKFVLPALLLLNFIGIFLFRKDLQFVKGPILLFILLVITFIVYRFFIAPGKTEQVQAGKQAEIAKQGWDYLGQPETDAEFIKQENSYRITNLVLFRISGLQAAFAFIFSVIGLFVSAEKKIYGAFALGFLLLSFLFLK